jgi:DNA-binding transcriptional LysR family regulator
MEIKSTETIKQAVIADLGISFLSAHTIKLELQSGSLAVLDVEGFPVMLNWYLVHRRNKRLPPVALAFKNFLMNDGAALIEQITRVDPVLVKRAKKTTASSKSRSKQ